MQPLAFANAVHALSVLRYITDYINEVPLSVMHRILNTNDTVTQLIYLLQKKPWQHKKKSGEWMRFDDGRWAALELGEEALLGKVEAQVCLAGAKRRGVPTCLTCPS